MRQPSNFTFLPVRTQGIFRSRAPLVEGLFVDVEEFRQLLRRDETSALEIFCKRVRHRRLP